MTEKLGTATLIAKDESLAVRFDPPLESLWDFHPRKSDYLISQVIRQRGRVLWIVYNQEEFGCGGAQREDVFIDYCEQQVETIGYEVVNALLHTSAPVPVVDEA